MGSSMTLMVSSLLLVLSSCSVYGKTVSSPTPSPAPAPGPAYLNLTELLSVAGPFHTFLDYLESTKVIDTFQEMANNSDEGITIFVPKDQAFSLLKSPSLSNLTQDQIKQLVLYHAFSHYYSLSDFSNITHSTPMPTLAGGDYTLNLTDVSGTIHINTGWTATKVSSSVHSTDPVAVYQVDKVLLPEAIFGTDIPPTPAPVPAPEVSPTADTPGAENATASAPESSTKDSSSYRTMSWGIWTQLVFALSGGLFLWL